MNGSANQLGGASTHAAMLRRAADCTAASVTTAKQAPSPSAFSKACTSGHSTQETPASRSRAAATAALRPCGARTNALVTRALGIGISPGDGLEQRRRASDEGRNPAQHPVELRQRRPQFETAAGNAELPDRVLVPAGALLAHDRQRTR